MISCWSIWDGKKDPWNSFPENSFTQDEKNMCAIVSTVGKVRHIFNQTIDISEQLLGSNFQQIVLGCFDGAMNYYSCQTGVTLDNWKAITDFKRYGLAMKPVQNIFHKIDVNKKGQRYDVEKEYRYALLIGGPRFFGSDTNIAINSDNILLRDFPLILRNGNHYIDKIYLKIYDESIVTTAYFGNIELVKKYENYADQLYSNV